MFQTNVARNIETYFMFDNAFPKGVLYMGKCGKMW